MLDLWETQHQADESAAHSLIVRTLLDRGMEGFHNPLGNGHEGKPRDLIVQRRTRFAAASEEGQVSPQVARWIQEPQRHTVVVSWPEACLLTSIIEVVERLCVRFMNEASAHAALRWPLGEAIVARHAGGSR